jgi:cyclopropane fatty-acyl-phospholipid synthase-like methyltransferase
MTVQSNYWSEYYSDTRVNNSIHTTPSQFAAFCALEAKEAGISKLIDIACGDGRDSVFFAQLGFEVLALEKSSAAIEIVTSRSMDLNNLKAIQIDVTSKKLPQMNSSNDVSAYYARFFLHTLAEPQVSTFFKNLSNAMHISQLFFTEYRSEKDASLTKCTPYHDRYFHKPTSIKMIAKAHNLDCVYEVQGRGFAKWKTDDAEVVRQVFVKSN